MATQVMSAGYQQTSSYAVIDWSQTTDLCSDVRCPCGEDFHHCTHGGCGSAQYARCPYCKDVVCFDTRVNLSLDEIDFNRRMPPHAFVQWRGTVVTMTAHCACGTQFPVAGDFTYELDCPGCRAHYHCDPDVLITKLSAEEAKGVDLIHEPEKEWEDMTPEEQEECQRKWEKS